MDLWEQILHFTDWLGDEVKWLYVPFHIRIKINGRADHLADVGLRRSPPLFGSQHTHTQETEDAPGIEEDLLWGWKENEHI